MRESNISFLLSKTELKLFEKILFLEPGLVDGLESAKKEKGKYRVKFAIADLEDAPGALSYFANTLANSEEERKQLYKLREKIEGYLALHKDFRKSILKQKKRAS